MSTVPLPTPTPPVTPYVVVTYSFTNYTPATFTTTEQMNLISELSANLGIPNSDITIVSIVAGSAVVTLYITVQTLAEANQIAAQIPNIVITGLGPYTLLIVQVINPAVSNICFPSGTPITTDQGIIPIEALDKNVHTIGNKDILHVTHTVTLDKYLICFEKDALDFNYPNNTTIMTKDHKVLYNGTLVPAHKFLGDSSQVKKVIYSGEILYNVLLEDYSTMKVNNMVCETLHPDNVIAKLHMSTFSEDYKQNMISIMNESLIKRDLHAYKAIVNRAQF